MGDSSFALTFCLHIVLQIWSNNIWTFFLSYKDSEYNINVLITINTSMMTCNFSCIFYIPGVILYFDTPILNSGSKYSAIFWTQVQYFAEKYWTPPIKYWTGVKNIMATKYWTQFCVSISHWKRDSKYYYCKLNFPLIFHSNWKGGLKSYVREIFWTTSPCNGKGK